MVIHVYEFSRKNNDVFDHHLKYAKEHPEKYLFSYNGIFDWSWRCIQVGGSYYTFCIGADNKDPGYYFVERYNYRPEMTDQNTLHNAYCPACGSYIDWEHDDGLVDCSICGSTLQKFTKIDNPWEDYYHAGYTTHLVKLYKPIDLTKDIESGKVYMESKEELNERTNSIDLLGPIRNLVNS